MHKWKVALFDLRDYNRKNIKIFAGSWKLSGYWNFFLVEFNGIIVN